MQRGRQGSPSEEARVSRPPLSVVIAGVDRASRICPACDAPAIAMLGQVRASGNSSMKTGTRVKPADAPLPPRALPSHRGACEQALLDDGVDAPVAVDYLGDA